MTQYSRKDEFTSKASNPCKKFLSWDQKAKSFTYYDKEEKKDVVVELPIKFIKLKELSTVKGWHTPSNSGIFSNEVVNLRDEEINVRSFKGGDIVKGIYSKIKPVIKDNGGHYEKSIYVIDGTGELLNIALKGSGVGAWSNFLEKEGRKAALDNWIIIEEAIEEKKGSIAYNMPSFAYLKEITADESGEADKQYRTFMDYFSSYSTPIEEVKTDEADD